MSMTNTDRGDRQPEVGGDDWTDMENDLLEIQEVCRDDDWVITDLEAKDIFSVCRDFQDMAIVVFVYELVPDLAA